MVLKKILGSQDADVLRGTDGFDALFGLRGADRLWGGAGTDTLWGGEGNDSLYGGEGADVLIGGIGADFLDGGAGFDWVTYSDAEEGVVVSLVAGAQAGWAEGDTLLNIEAVVGSKYDDVLTGSRGANTLNGGAGNDMLDGSNGNDVLIAGSGDDTLLGGSGSDTFEFYASTRNSHAVIADFEVGHDVVEFNFEGREMMEGIVPMTLLDGSGVRLALGGSIVDILGVTAQELQGENWLSMVNWEPYWP